MSFPGETPNKVEVRHFLETFQDAMDQEPYGAMLRGELLYAALQLAPRNLDDIPPIANTATEPGANQAALRAQVEYENKLKQEFKEALSCVTTRTASRCFWRHQCGRGPD
eukprot:1307311-Pleurochrysis_carterae.AAC.1